MHLDLKSHTTNPTILSSLAWNAIRDVLTKAQRWELLDYIESIKITEKRIAIKTTKPIVNHELSNYSEAIRERIDESFENFGVVKVERKVVFI